ncbi:hypothetical protein R6Q59_003624 [Mikania micrantha]
MALKFTCVNGGRAAPPATLAEFTLNGANAVDFYNVTGYVADLNTNCPSELRLTMTTGDESVACRSACEAFGGCSIQQVSEFGDGGVDCGETLSL